MSTFVRSFDPIWFNVDLQANAFDDTFYLWTLQNTIPYLPQAVYHDPLGQVPWTDPIQFLANGTLPVDIYWDPNLVYRLEFRQNVNGLTPSQNDVLIYEVDNYEPGTGSVTPVGSGAITDNQITNPQFSLISFSDPLVLTTVVMTPSTPIHIGPGWDLILSGTGNVTISREEMSSTQTNVTNAPYAIRIQLAAWTDPPILRQRFNENGMNWSGLNVSSSITAKGTAGAQISARLVDSMGQTLVNVLNSVALSAGSFNEFKDFGLVPIPPTNTDTPPNAWIDYQLLMPTAGDFYFTSFQLIASGIDIAAPFSYEQDTINRQIDHTYNTAYPIVPVGTVIDFGGFSSPSHYLPCVGQTVKRLDFNLLFQATTNLETVTLTMDSASITVADGTAYHISAPVEGIGIRAGTTISNIVANAITLSATATANGPSLLRFFAAGNGDGLATFQVYDLQGVYIAGAGGTLFSSGGTGASLLQTGGSANRTITGVNTNLTVGATPINVVSTTTFSILPPTVLLRKFIRFE